MRDKPIAVPAWIRQIIRVIALTGFGLMEVLDRPKVENKPRGEI